MEKFLPTVCYFPTTVLLIDDDRRYLDGLAQELDAKKAYYRKFYDPRGILDFFAGYNSNSFAKRCIIRQEEERLEHRTLDIDVRSIHREANNGKRFTEVAVIIVDYAMPYMNGLELCKLLKQQPCKKLLLTGEADETLAVRAFNDGLIDKFIRKDSSHFKLALNQAVQDLQKQYFHQASATLVNALTTDMVQPAVFLTDKIFMDFFEELMQKLNATEFYLMDSEGSFMLLDLYGNPSWLAMKNEKAMQSLTEFAKYDATPTAVMQALQERHKIPYFHTEDELQTPACEWQPFLHAARKLEGKDTYYYAIITNRKFSVNEKIFSFMEYCQKIAY